MLTSQAALAGITCATMVYGALSCAAPAIIRRLNIKKVGGLTFLRLGAYQLSVCRPRPQSVISAERMAQATMRAQSREDRRLDAIASRWCNG